MNVFLDCGTHLCQGLLEFHENKIINSSYKIYIFEANPTTYGYAFHRIKQNNKEFKYRNTGMEIKYIY